MVTYTTCWNQDSHVKHAPVCPPGGKRQPRHRHQAKAPHRGLTNRTLNDTPRLVSCRCVCLWAPFITSTSHCLCPSNTHSTRHTNAADVRQGPGYSGLSGFQRQHCEQQLVHPIEEQRAKESRQLPSCMHNNNSCQHACNPVLRLTDPRTAQHRRERECTHTHIYINTNTH